MANFSVQDISFVIPFVELIALASAVWRLSTYYNNVLRVIEKRHIELTKVLERQSVELRQRCSDLECQVRYLDKFLQKKDDDYTSIL